MGGAGAKEGKLDFQRMWKVKGLYVGPLESEFHGEWQAGRWAGAGVLAQADTRKFNTDYPVYLAKTPLRLLCYVSSLASTFCLERKIR